MFNNKEYLFKRTAWPQQLSIGMEDESNQALVIDRLNDINNGEERPIKLVGVFSSSYPANFRVLYENDEEREVEVWVKETRVGYDVTIPPAPINECKLMGSVILDMFFRRRSPHFVYPIRQIITNDRAGGGAGGQEHMVIYNIMEYLPKNTYVRFSDWIRGVDVKDPETKFKISTAVFQILYNLVVMANLEMTHGDLHMDNILICPTMKFYAMYGVTDENDEPVYYDIPSLGFVVFVDFGLSTICTGNYRSITSGSKEFDPYVDIRTFSSQLFLVLKSRPELVPLIFPKDASLKGDIERLVGSGGFEGCLPGRVLIRYARQFFTENQAPLPLDRHAYLAYE